MCLSVFTTCSLLQAPWHFRLSLCIASKPVSLPFPPLHLNFAHISSLLQNTHCFTMPEGHMARSGCEDFLQLFPSFQASEYKPPASSHNFNLRMRGKKTSLFKTALVPSQVLGFCTLHILSHLMLTLKAGERKKQTREATCSLFSSNPLRFYPSPCFLTFPKTVPFAWNSFPPSPHICVAFQVPIQGHLPSERSPFPSR